MAEERITIATPAGDIAAWRGGTGADTAVLLHGGPGLSDYLGTLTPLLDERFRTVRYQQRGLAPTTIGPPHTVEANVEDAVAVIDHEAGGRAVIVGHSWGGHLALHLLVAAPDRLAGAIIIDPLGAHMDVMAQFVANLRRGLDPDELARLDEIDARERAGEVSEDPEGLRIIWRNYFADPGTASPMPPMRQSAEANSGVFASLTDHAAAGTLTRGLPRVPATVPVLFIYGEQSPMPARATTATAALVPHARVAPIEAAGHFPWLEQPEAVVAALDM
jgi:proline iminopeptidase